MSLLLVGAITVAAVFLFVSGRLRIDLVSLLVLVAPVATQLGVSPRPFLFAIAFGDSALSRELAVWSRTMAQNPRRLRSDLNFAIDAAFREHGITVPFPQRVVRLTMAPEPAPDVAPRGTADPQRGRWP